MRRTTVAAERANVMTLEDWAALDEEVDGELVDGVLEEEEVPSFLHEIVVTWLIARLEAWVRRRKGQVGGSETKLAVGARRGRKADLCVFLPERMPALEDALVRVAPHVVVEVVSPRPRDARRDRVDKLRDYSRSRIPYYWIVDPQLRSLEVFERGADGRYAVALAVTRGRARVPGCRGLTIDLDALWERVAEAERAHQRPVRRRSS